MVSLCPTRVIVCKKTRENIGERRILYPISESKRDLGNFFWCRTTTKVIVVFHDYSTTARLKYALFGLISGIVPRLICSGCTRLLVPLIIKYITRAPHGCRYSPAPMFRVWQGTSWNCFIRHKQKIDLQKNAKRYVRIQ